VTDTAKDKTEQPDYLSYLLRLWRESEEKAVWRASLESPRTGECTGFASLDALFDFLRQQIDDGLNDLNREERSENGTQAAAALE
jgi:hypothetical protein